MIVKASGLPESLQSAAGTAVFSPVLNIPAGLVNTPFQVRGEGSLLFPAGVYNGYVVAGLYAQGSPNAPVVGSGTGLVVVNGPERVVPFSFKASLIGIPFLGSFVDTQTRANTPPLGIQSGATVGEVGYSQPCQPIGGGELDFSDETPLVVQLILASNQFNPVALPTISAMLNKFELEY